MSGKRGENRDKGGRNGGNREMGKMEGTEERTGGKNRRMDNGDGRDGRDGRDDDSDSDISIVNSDDEKFNTDEESEGEEDEKNIDEGKNDDNKDEDESPSPSLSVNLINITANNADYKLDITELDNIDSIKLRICSKFHTISKLLILEEKYREKEVSEVQIISNCKAISVSSGSVNKNITRQFTMEFFEDEVKNILKSGRSSDDYAKVLNASLKKKYNILSDVEFLTYIVYFVFKSLENFEYRTNQLIVENFKQFVNRHTDLRSWDLFLIKYNDEEILKERSSVDKKVQDNDDLFRFYSSMKYNKKTITPIQFTKTHLISNFEIRTDIYEIFNNAILSPEVPFIAVGNFFKLYNGFKPPKEWIEEYKLHMLQLESGDSLFGSNVDDIMIMYVLNKYIEPERNKINPNAKNYSIVSFRVLKSIDEDKDKDKDKDNEKEEGKGKSKGKGKGKKDKKKEMKERGRENLQREMGNGEEKEKGKEREKEVMTRIEMDVQSRIDDELRLEKLLGRIFNAVNREIFNCVYEQKKVDSDFLIKINEDRDGKHRLDIPLFYDMVMNDPYVSQFLVINESYQTFRERGGIFLYFRENNFTEGKRLVSCRISLVNIDLKSKARAPELFRGLNPVGILVKLISVENEQQARKISKILTKVIQYYYSTAREKIRYNYESIFGEEFSNAQFSLYEPNLSMGKIQRDVKLKDIDPDMFISDYKRVCSSVPTIIGMDEVEEYKRMGKDVMIFPLYGESQQRAYTCNHKEAKFVGIRKNKLDNSEKYPLLPCCYVAQQTGPNRLRGMYESLKNSGDGDGNNGDGNIRDNKDGGEQSRKKKDLIKSLGSLGTTGDKISGSKKGSKIFISNKALKPGISGYLPPLVDKFLHNIDPNAFIWTDEHISFIREGSIKDKNSALDAICKAVYQYWDDLDGDSKQGYRRYLNSRMPNKLLDKIFSIYKDDNSPINKEMDDEEENKDEEDNLSKSEFLSILRKNIIQYIHSGVLSQSSYGFEKQALIEYIIGDVQYFDIKIFWRVLEDIFNINIFLFRRNSENTGGTIGTPLYLEDYILYAKKRKFNVILFETTGAEFDNLKYPQVELIKIIKNVKLSSGKIESISFSVFSNREPIVKNLKLAINEMFSRRGKVNIPVSSELFNTKIVSQKPDFYGKIRFIQFKKLCVQTDPIPPIDSIDVLDSTDAVNFSPVGRRVAFEFMRDENIENREYERIISGDKVIGYSFSKYLDDDSISTGVNKIRIYIPIIPYDKNDVYGEEIENGGDTDSLYSPEYGKSRLVQYNNLSRLTRYIVEYTLWVFSHWFSNVNANSVNVDIAEDSVNSVQDIDFKTLVKFAKEKFVIKENHIYPEIVDRRFFHNCDGILDQMDRIIVINKDTRNRLLYSLQLRLKRNTREVLSYKNRIYIKNYYQNISDFSTNSTTVILYGIDSLERWKNDNRIKYYKLYDSIRLDAGGEPYYLKLSRINPYKISSIEDEEGREGEEGEGEEKEQGEKEKKIKVGRDKGGQVIEESVYIAQEASSLENAIYISQTWNTQGYNPIDEEGEISVQDSSFIYIQYEGMDKIKYYIVNEGDKLYKRNKILHYRINDEDKFVSLLDIEDSSM